MSASLSPLPKLQFFDANGNPLVGGRLYTFAAGTTTPLDTYTDNTGTIAASNPIILNGRGECEVWLGGAPYKFRLETSAGVEVWTVDNVTQANADQLQYTPAATSLLNGVVTTVSGGLNELSHQSTGSSRVGFLQAGSGAVQRTVQSKLRETVSVKDFGAVGDGVADDTVAIQAGVTAASATGQVLFFPAATYKVTDTINLPLRAKLRGEQAGPGNSYSAVLPLSSTINFAPTTQKSLFVATGAIGGGTGNLKSWISVEGLQLTGNSVAAGGNSEYALDLSLVIYSAFRDIGIQGFNTGIQLNQTQGNRFENIKIVNCTEQCVLYGVNPITATSDVWEQCTFRLAPIGVQTECPSLGIRFNNCLFEGLYTYGVNLVKESRMWLFTNCYAETVPAPPAAGGTTTGNEAMFRVGYDGTAMVNDMNLVVIGGTFTGRNELPRGLFLDCDYAGGAQLLGIVAGLYTNIIRATANTRDNSLILLGIQFNQAIFETGLAGKYQGFIPSTGISLAPSQDFLCRIFTATNRFVGPTLRLNGATATGSAGEVTLGTTTATTVGAAGGASALPATPSGYWQIDIAGTKYKVPYYAN